MPRLNVRRPLSVGVFVIFVAGLLGGGCTIVLSSPSPAPVTVVEPSEPASVPGDPARIPGHDPNSSSPLPDSEAPVDIPDVGPPTNFEERRAQHPDRPEFTSDFPEDVYAGAGGAVTPGARAAMAVRDGDTAVILTPSGNIGCDLFADHAGCGVLSMTETNVMGSDQGGAKWWVDLIDGGSPWGVPEVVSRGDAPLYMNPDVPAQVVQYGQVIRHGDIVCASESTGLTCWDIWSGHGAFMNKTWIYTW